MTSRSEPPPPRRGRASAPAAEVVEAAAAEFDLPALLQRVPAILYTADPGPRGAWHYVSPQIEAILGFTADEWCADPALWSERLHPEDRARVLAVDQRSAIGDGSSDAADYRLLHRDGHVVWVRDDSLLIRGDDGSIRWHGVMTDVTERKLAEAELERSGAQQAAVARLGEHALEGASTPDLMQEAIGAVVSLLGVEFAAVVELLPDGSGLVFRATHGLPDAAISFPLPAGTRSQAGFSIVSGAPVTVLDWEHEERFTQSPILSTVGARSGLTVVIEGRRTPFGVLGVHTVARREFADGEIDFVQAIANVLGNAFERQLTESNIRHRALHDKLTDLPNRVLFIDRLQQSSERLRRRRGLAAVLFLDLDRFKLVNDSLGHQIGDELLTEVAPRIRQALRSSDTVARFGGDEFAVLLEDISSEREAIEMAQRIAAALLRPFVVHGGEHFISSSIGIALAQGGELAEDLVRDADAAMHRAKERGRGRYELFDEALRGRAIARLRVENDLRRAVERDEFVLEYQPLVSLRDHSIVGVEALIRWEHPKLGRIAPGDFIAVAEESGLIEPIGRWVLGCACRQGARWYHQRPDAAPLSISVNLSAIQVANRCLVQTVAGALGASGLEPSCLTLEITESVMLGDNESLTGMLAQLKALGVQVVLDDFGTGYSSLAYLTRLPLDALKVDRSFIDGLAAEPRDRAITEAIVAMSHALSLEVVAEGAETAAQVAELSRIGCDYVQGYHFSRPVAAEEITRMLERGPAWPVARARGADSAHG